MKWETVEIGKIAKVISGYAFKSNDFQLDGIPVIKIKNIKNENVVLNEGDCVDSIIEVHPRFHLCFGDILISLTGSHISLPSSVVGRVAKYRHASISYLNQRAGKFINIDTEKCFQDYLFYFLIQKEITTRIALKAQGAANQANISPGDVEGIDITLPPLPIQRKIASILSTYDDLIENNLKRIKLLEEKALLSYKEIMKSKKGEKIGLGEIATINKESLKRNHQIGNMYYIDISSVTKGSIDEKTQLDIKDAPGRAKRIVLHQDIIWSCVRPNRKSYALIWKPEENLIVSTGFAVISKSQIPPIFLYHCVTTDDFVQYLENNATGSAYPAVTAKDFEKAIITVPKNEIMSDFQEMAMPVFELIYTLKKQNNKLREARDVLLPKLMNGEIEV